MIKIFNADKLTSQAFFRDLIAYLERTQAPNLRQIKAAFPDVSHLDRQLDSYIAAGYIRRADKRYYLILPLLTNLDEVDLASQIFIDDKSPLYQDLLAKRFETALTNQTNAAKIIEQTSITRDELTLANYFHKLASGAPLTDKQGELYAILGDVNPEYALKYLTSFLLKFERKDEVMQKRRDIFVDSLVLLGYIIPQESGKYRLNMLFDPETLTFRSVESRR